MDKSFRPKSGRYGLMIAYTAKEFGANPFTANSTVTFQCPSPPGKAYPLRAYVFCETLAVDADGTCTLQLIRREAAGDTDIALTDAYNVEGLTTLEKTALTFVSTLTDAQRIFLEADILEVDLVSNSAAIDTQPTDLTLVVEWAILE